MTLSSRLRRTAHRTHDYDEIVEQQYDEDKFRELLVLIAGRLTGPGIATST